MKKWIVLMLFFLFLSPVSASDPYASMIEKEEWDEVLEKASTKRLSSDRFHAEAISYHALHHDEAAWEIIRLYLACYDAKDLHYEEMLHLAVPVAWEEKEYAFLLAIPEKTTLTESEARICYQAARVTGNEEKAKEIFSTYLRQTMDDVSYAMMLIESNASFKEIEEASQNLSPDETISVYTSYAYAEHADMDAQELFGKTLSLEADVTDKKSYYQLLARLALLTDQRVLARKYQTLAQSEE